MKWYKHDPSAALAGMIGLTVEERGAYYTLMDLQYARAPHNDVTDELVVKALGVRPQVWRRLKASLIAKGKVHESDGRLTANRVETQVKLAFEKGVFGEFSGSLHGGFGGHVVKNQPHSNSATVQVCPGDLESRITSSFPTAARESEKRKKKRKNRSAGSLASARPTGALARQPKAVASPSLEEIIQAKGWKDEP